MKTIYKHARFITGGESQYPGTLAHTGLGVPMEEGFLAFLCLVGTIYFNKYSTGFSTTTAEKLLHKHTQTYPTPLTQHTKWLEWQTMWERTQFEDDMMPSDDALHLHWKRVCWVVDMWRQANTHNLCLQPMTEYGWRLENDTLIYDRDSEVNMAEIKQRVSMLLKGCKCRTGCGSAACGCKKKGERCHEGCDCIGCMSNDHEAADDENVPDRDGGESELEREVDNVPRACIPARSLTGVF